MENTAIDWLYNKLILTVDEIYILDEEEQHKLYLDIFKQAKNIYRQELINACTLGYLAESSTEYQNLIKLLKNENN
jgi:hypothetical protein